MSTCRSRSGGTRISKTSIRERRSSRKVPRWTSSSRSRRVVARSRECGELRDVSSHTISLTCSGAVRRSISSKRIDPVAADAIASSSALTALLPVERPRQSTWTQGLSRRGDPRCSRRASMLRPEPGSPTSRTGASCGATSASARSTSSKEDGEPVSGCGGGGNRSIARREQHGPCHLRRRACRKATTGQAYALAARGPRTTHSLPRAGRVRCAASVVEELTPFLGEPAQALWIPSR